MIAAPSAGDNPDHPRAELPGTPGRTAECYPARKSRLVDKVRLPALAGHETVGAETVSHLLDTVRAVW